MPKTNNEHVGDALLVLAQGLAPFVEREMKAVYKDRWLEQAFYNASTDGKQNPTHNNLEDVQVLIKVILNQWKPIFSNALSSTDRNLIFELKDVRNDWAHQKNFTLDDTYRAFDTCVRLLKNVSANEEAKKLEDLKNKLLHQIKIETQISKRSSSPSASTIRAKDIRRYPYSDILGWSASRYEMFKTCSRKYYHHYYFRHDPECDRNKVQQLKEMTSGPLEIGKIFHDVVKTLLSQLKNSNDAVSQSDLLNYALRETKSRCQKMTFSEIYYGEKKQIEDTDLFPAVEEGINVFLNSDRYKWILATEMEDRQDWLFEPSGYGETRIGGLKAYCKVDFLLPNDGKIFIIDWKTGRQREEKHRKQMCGYVLWAYNQLEGQKIDIAPVIAYVSPEYSEVKLDFNKYDLVDFAATVNDETQEMYSYCKDVENNIPKDKETFHKTNYESICDYCNFREVCE